MLAMHAPVRALYKKASAPESLAKYTLLVIAETNMASRAEEARARVEAQLRKQYEADRAA